MSNIDYFNRVVGITFGILYESFPIPVNINFSSTYTDIIFDNNNDAIYKRQIVEATLDWLQYSGYIVFTKQQNKHLGIEKAFLTGKALEALHKIPNSINSDKKPIGENLSNITKEVGIRSCVTILSNELTDKLNALGELASSALSTLKGIV